MSAVPCVNTWTVAGVGWHGAAAAGTAAHRGVCFTGRDLLDQICFL